MAVLGAVGDTFVSSVAPLFILALGSTPLYIGLLATTEHIQKIARFVGIRLVSRTGKGRLMAGSRALAVLPVFGLTVLALWGTPSLYAILIALILIAAREFIRQVGNTVWWALIQDNTAGDAFGTFMARLRVRQRWASLVVPILVGWYLGTSPVHGRFGWLFVAGIVTGLMGAYWSLGVREGKPASQTQGAFGQLSRAFRLPRVAWLAAFMSTYQLLYAAAGSMWVVALSNHGLGAMAFVWMGSLAALGQVISLSTWGRLVDVHGPRSTLSLTLLSKAAIGLAWLTLPTESTPLHIWAGLFYLAWGVLDGGQNLARSRAMMDAVPNDNQVAGFNAIMYAGSLGGIVGGVGGGWAFGYLVDTDAYWQGYPAELVYLTSLQVLLVISYFLTRKLTGYNENQSTREVLRSGLK